MARPQRNSVDYFPFFCDEGNKMFYIEETYGNDGFAVFVKLLRELAKTEYHYLDLSKKSKVMFLSAKCKVESNILESIINDLVELEKFDEELWNENKIIWCQDFIDSIQDAYNKRSNSCIDKNSLITLLQVKGIRKPPKSSSKPSKGKSKDPVNTQSKEEYNKEEKNNNINARKLAFKESLYPFVGEYSKETVKDFFEYWSEHGEKDKKMRFEKEKSFDKSRRLKTWVKNDFNKTERKKTFSNNAHLFQS